MELARSLLREFASVTDDTAVEDGGKTTYGTVVVRDSVNYVQFDGSTLLTPVETLFGIQNGDRVQVLVKDHKATVTGNVTSVAKTRGVDGNYTRTMSSASSALSRYYNYESQLYFSDSTVNLEPADTVNVGDLVNFSASYSDFPASLATELGLTPGSSFTIYSRIVSVNDSSYDAQVVNMTETTGGPGTAGEDAVLLRIDSTRGTVFKNNMVSTVLTVSVFVGSDIITNITQLRSKFGAGAYLQWYWLRVDDSDYGIIVSTDPKLSNDGFSLTLTPNDFDTKVTFRCQLIV